MTRILMFNLSDISSSLLFTLVATSSCLAPAAGQDLTIESSPNPPTAEDARLYAIDVISPNDIWTVGLWQTSDFQNFPLALHYDGNSWNITSTPQPLDALGRGNAVLHDVASTGPSQVYAVGSYVRADQTQTTDTFFIEWDGTGWQQLLTPGQSTNSAGGYRFEAIAAITENDIWFAGGGYDQDNIDRPRNLLVHYDGSDFDEVIYMDLLSNSGHRIRDLDALASDDIWAVGAHGGVAAAQGLAHVAHFDGYEWSYVTIPAFGIDENLVAVEAIAPDDVWISGSYAFVNSKNELEYVPLFLHWDGNGWTQFDSPNFADDLVALSSDDIYGVNRDTLIHWDGTKWSTIANLDVDPQLFPALRGVDVVPSTDEVITAGSVGGNPDRTLVARYDIADNETGTPATLQNFEFVFGTHITGGLPELIESDDAYLQGRSSFGFLSSEPNLIDLHIGAVTAQSDVDEINLTIESRLNNPGGSVTLRLRDWDTNSLEEVHSYTLGTTEVRETANVADASPYVRDGDGRIELSVKSVVVATFSLSGFRVEFDQVTMEVNQ